jgi:hypothetical protein
VLATLAFGSYPIIASTTYYTAPQPRVGIDILVPLQSRAPKGEYELIQELNSSSTKIVIKALTDLEKKWGRSTNAIPAIKRLVTDSDSKVRRKAARVLADFHADVNQTDIDNICALLKSSDSSEIVDGLKALRGLKAQSAIPEIVPLLKHTNNNVIRDSCRTLAVLGDKNLIPQIEPLLEFPDVKVQKDAADAIDILKLK